MFIIKYTKEIFNETYSKSTFVRKTSKTFYSIANSTSNNIVCDQRGGNQNQEQDVKERKPQRGLCIFEKYLWETANPMEEFWCRIHQENFKFPPSKDLTRRYLGRRYRKIVQQLNKNKYKWRERKVGVSQKLTNNARTITFC